MDPRPAFPALNIELHVTNGVSGAYFLHGSRELRVNPKFAIPFVLCHETAHGTASGRTTIDRMNTAYHSDYFGYMFGAYRNRTANRCEEAIADRVATILTGESRESFDARFDTNPYPPVTGARATAYVEHHAQLIAAKIRAAMPNP